MLRYRDQALQSQHLRRVRDQGLAGVHQQADEVQHVDPSLGILAAKCNKSNQLHELDLDQRTSEIQQSRCFRKTFVPNGYLNQSLTLNQEYGATLLHSSAGQGDRSAMKTFLQTFPIDCQGVYAQLVLIRTQVFV